jgi:hypothetical protein
MGRVREEEALRHAGGTESGRGIAGVDGGLVCEGAVTSTGGTYTRLERDT